MDKIFFLSSVLVNFLLIFLLIRKVNYLYFLPFLPFAGKWLVYLIPNIHFIFYSYWEILLSTIILFRYFDFQKYKNGFFLFFLGILAIIPIVRIVSAEDLITHLFYLYLFFCSIAFYNYFVKTSALIHTDRAVNIIALTWVFLSFYYRFVCSIDYHVNLLFIRGGSSLWASNHNGMILLMFLPLIKHKYVKLAVILTLITFFSRGIYVCLIFYGIMSLRMIRFNFRFFKYVISVSTILCVFFFSSILDQYKDFLILRFIGGSSVTNNIENIPNIAITDVDFDSILAVLESDDRNEIKRVSFNMIADYKGLGTGFGNFQESVKRIDSTLDYSNAHNLYITIIAELGILFFIFFLVFFLKNLTVLYYKNRRVFKSLLIFLLFGLFSAQLYEEASEKGIMDFVYLMFLFSFSNSSFSPEFPEETQLKELNE